MAGPPDEEIDEEIRFHLAEEARLRRRGARWTRRAPPAAISATSSACAR